MKNFESKPYNNLVDGFSASDTEAAQDRAPRVSELIDRLGRLTRELQYVDGLNPAQWETLRFLSRANCASRTPSAVAQFLCATKGTVSQTITALENKGLLTRSPSATDKRVCMINLTDKGHDLLSRDPVKRIENTVTEMDDSAASAMVQGLNRLLSALQSDRDGAAFGICNACCSHISTRDLDGAVGKCGMTGLPLTLDDSQRLCVNFSTH